MTTEPVIMGRAMFDPPPPFLWNIDSHDTLANEELE